MSRTTSQEGTEVLDLHEQLERDSTGALRDRLMDELQVAADEISAALGNRPVPAEAMVLKGLLEAVQVSGQVLTDAWNALHGANAGMSPVLSGT